MGGEWGSSVPVGPVWVCLGGAEPCGCRPRLQLRLRRDPRSPWQGMLMHRAAALRCQPAAAAVGVAEMEQGRAGERGMEPQGCCWSLGRAGCPLQSIIPAGAVCSGLRSADLAAARCLPVLHSPFPKNCSCPTLLCPNSSQVPAALPGWVIINYLPFSAVKGMRLPLFVLTELL